MTQDRNPLIEPEDFFAGYNKNIDELKKDPAIIEFDRLVYEVWEHSEAGRKLMELCVERYLIPGLAQPGCPTYQIDILGAEGFKNCLRMFRNCVLSHKQRIKAGMNKS